jgi:sulfate-transporting ATPase
MSEHYIMTIEELTKIYEQKEVLSNIWLSFYPGAKIGVLGYNGSGKSTLLRIMAGKDKDFMGTVRPKKGTKIAYFEQEPHLEPDQTVEQCLNDAVAESRAILDRYNKINMKFAEEMTPEEMEKVLEEQAVVQDIIDAGNLWELDRELEIASDAMRCLQKDAVIGNLSGGEKRRVALCQLLLQTPTFCYSTNRPTTSMRNQSVGWNDSSNHFREPWSPSRTTVISSTMSPAGFWNSTGDTATRMKETIRLGWNKNKND